MYAVHIIMIIVFSMSVLIYVATVYVCEQYYLKFAPQWEAHPCVTPWLHKRNFIAKVL